jgi:hypothetical protein
MPQDGHRLRSLSLGQALPRRRWRWGPNLGGPRVATGLALCGQGLLLSANIPEETIRCTPWREVAPFGQYPVRSPRTAGALGGRRNISAQGVSGLGSTTVEARSGG